MEKDDPKLEYDVQKRAKAGTAATFRGVVAAYIAYLGYRLIKGADSTLFIVIGIFFILAAAASCFYIYKRWKIDLEAARLKPEDPAIEAPDPSGDPDRPEE